LCHLILNILLINIFSSSAIHAFLGNIIQIDLVDIRLIAVLFWSQVWIRLLLHHHTLSADKLVLRHYLVLGSISRLPHLLFNDLSWILNKLIALYLVIRILMIVSFNRVLLLLLILSTIDISRLSPCTFAFPLIWQSYVLISTICHQSSVHFLSWIIWRYIRWLLNSIIQIR